MFGIGTTELIVILVVALIVLGPDKLPKVAKTMGKAMGEFKRMSSDVQTTIKKEMDRLEDEEVKPKAMADTKAETKTAEVAPDTTGKDAANAVPVKDIPKPEAMQAAGIPGEVPPSAGNAGASASTVTVVAEAKTDPTGGKA